MISASCSVLCALWQAVLSSKMQAGKYSVCVPQLGVECLPRGRCFFRKNSRCFLALIYKVEVVAIIKELYVANSKRTMAALFAVLIAWTKRNDQMWLRQSILVGKERERDRKKNPITPNDQIHII